MNRLMPLIATEARLLVRDWSVVPSRSASIGVPVIALALVGLPVALASYREHGALRRLEAFGPGGKECRDSSVPTE